MTTTTMIQRAKQLLAANGSENGLNLDFDSRLVDALENAKFDLCTYGTSAIQVDEHGVRHVPLRDIKL